jgi:hypothetical protein
MTHSVNVRTAMPYSALADIVLPLTDFALCLCTMLCAHTIQMQQGSPLRDSSNDISPGKQPLVNTAAEQQQHHSPPQYPPPQPPTAAAAATATGTGTAGRENNKPKLGTTTISTTASVNTAASSNSSRPKLPPRSLSPRSQLTPPGGLQFAQYHHAGGVKGVGPASPATPPRMSSGRQVISVRC